MSVVIKRQDAIDLFENLGFPTASKWNAKRMHSKITKIDEILDEDTVLEGTADKILTVVLEALEAGEEIELVVDKPGADKPKPKAKADGAKADKPKPKAKADGAKADKPKPKPKPKAKADKPKPKAKADDNDGIAKIPGVREQRTRPFLAGCIIRKYGMASGVTEAMVEELDELYGKTNPAESMFTLRNAWHAIRGWDEGDQGI